MSLAAASGESRPWNTNAEDSRSAESPQREGKDGREKCRDPSSTRIRHKSGDEPDSTSERQCADSSLDRAEQCDIYWRKSRAEQSECQSHRAREHQRRRQHERHRAELAHGGIGGERRQHECGHTDERDYRAKQRPAHLLAFDCRQAAPVADHQHGCEAQDGEVRELRRERDDAVLRPDHNRESEAPRQHRHQRQEQPSWANSSVRVGDKGEGVACHLQPAVPGRTRGQPGRDADSREHKGDG